MISCRRERDSLIARQAQIKQRQEQMEAARTRLAQVEAELGAARTEQEDYTYLARVFGPDEIQLCEIQAAGPEVSTLVNALLEGCFDNKFEIRFRTQRPKADGKGMVDDFDVEVRNKNLDRTCLVDELSGGQFVLVNEAVNLELPSTTCGRAKAFVTKRCSGTKPWELWMLSMARSMCACCAGLWTWVGSTKSSSSATRHSFGSWRTPSFPSVVAA